MEMILEEYNRTLKLKGYSDNTVKTYNAMFIKFLKAINGKDPKTVTTDQIRRFLVWMIDNKGIGTSHQNQLINAIKFYYEQVLKRPRTVYHLERPKKEKRLPGVLSLHEVQKILNEITNKKHLAIISMIYSAGLRISEVINLEISDIDSKRMQIRIEQSKGKKDRMSLLSEKILEACYCSYIASQFCYSFIRSGYRFEVYSGIARSWK